MQPPPIEGKRPKSRLGNKNIRNTNELGLKIPSKIVEDYEPDLDAHANLLGPEFSYIEEAKQKMNKAWDEYTKKREKILEQTKKGGKRSHTKRSHTKRSHTRRHTRRPRT